MSGWQPIETAPKDGSEFLAYDPMAKKYDVCTMTHPWSRLFECRAVQLDGELGAYEDEFQGSRATLWMPLPPAPEPYIEPRRPFLELD